MANAITVNFQEFDSVVDAILKTRLAILLRGPHGIGKSAVVYQIAKRLGLKVIELRAAQIEASDLIGLPSATPKIVNGKESTYFNPAEEIVRACTEPCVLLFDEIDRGQLEVRQAIFQLNDSRKLKGWELHPDTLVFAAVNGGLHRNASMYDVNEMDPAELDRFCVFDVAPTVTDWLTWGALQDENGLDNVDPMVRDFIKAFPMHLECGENETMEPNAVAPSRRSVKRYNDVLVNAGLLGPNCTVTNPSDADVQQKIFLLAAAIIGPNAGAAWRQYYTEYKRQVSAEDIMVKGDIKATEAFGINEHSTLLDRIVREGYLGREMNDEESNNLSRYFVTLPSEVAMQLWKLLSGSSDTENPEEAKEVGRKNTLRFHEAADRIGVDVASRIIELTVAKLKAS